jgi:hypothetical protein
MAVSKKVEMELIRNKYLELVGEFLASLDEEVMKVESNQIAFPCVGCEDNEYWCKITFTVPTGANKGTEPYDGYELARDYIHKCEEKEEKAKQKAEEKERKRKRDEEIRKKKAEQKDKG